jgi:hypothetical protein
MPMVFRRGKFGGLFVILAIEIYFLLYFLIRNFIIPIIPSIILILPLFIFYKSIKKFLLENSKSFKIINWILIILSGISITIFVIIINNNKYLIISIVVLFNTLIFLGLLDDELKSWEDYNNPEDDYDEKDEELSKTKNIIVILHKTEIETLQKKLLSLGLVQDNKYKFLYNVDDDFYLIEIDKNNSNILIFNMEEETNSMQNFNSLGQKIASLLNDAKLHHTTEYEYNKEWRHL